MKIFLNGGGSGTKTQETYKEINKIINHNKPVLYVPLAMDETKHPYDECYKWIKNEISIIDIPNIEMVKTFKELSEKDYNNYSMIFIGGGNTFKLLKGLKNSKSFEKLKKYINSDGIIFGSSAGTVIFSKDINVIEVMDENNVMLKDTTGFSILKDKSIFVHYTNYKTKLSKEENKQLTKKYTKFLLNYSKNNEEVIAIPEEDTLFIDDNNIKVLGNSPYYIFKNGVKNKIEVN